MDTDADPDIEMDRPAVTVVRERISLGFVNDEDRAFLYKVLAIHVRAGVVPCLSMERVEAIFASSRSDGPAGETRREGRRLGAERIARAFDAAASGRSVGERLKEAGMALTLEEEAMFALPPDMPSDVLADLFAFASQVLSGASRR